MLVPEHATTLEVVVRSRENLDSLLDAAVESLKPAAVNANAGIEVARTGIGFYRVSVRDHLPVGTSLELWDSPV